jgi:hypothetical protein
MCLYGGGIHQHVSRRAADLSTSLEEPDPDTLGGPADEAIVEGLARAIHAWRIDPAPTRLQHMHDAADHATIIDPRLAARAGWQVGRDLRELRIRQPEEVPTHLWPPEEVLNHEKADRSCRRSGRVHPNSLSSNPMPSPGGAALKKPRQRYSNHSPPKSSAVGMGFSIALTIVTTNSGHMEIENRNGAVFRVRLPLA